MRDLHHEIEYILIKGITLKDKYFDSEPMTLDHVTVYSKNNEEYDQLNEQAGKIGKLFIEKQDGIFFELETAIETNGFKSKFIKISKPEKDKLHKGSVSFVAPNFREFEKKFNDVQNMSLIKEEKLNKVELIDHDYDVYVFVTSKTFSEVNIDKKEKYDQEENGSEQIVPKKEDQNELEKLLDEEKQRRIHLMADFQNYQRRVEAERATLGAIANMGLIKEMLEIYDDLQLALNDESLNLEHAKTSMKSAQDKLLSGVESAGIEKIPVKVGEDFDKEKMEAVSAVPVKDDEHKGKIIAVISSAYKYKGKDGVLKPAKVVVGK